MASLLIKNGLVVDTEWTRHSDILVEGSRIKRIARNINTDDCPEDTHIVDASGLCVLPGIIDAHTHYHLVSRGTVTADSFLEGSKLASFKEGICSDSSSADKMIVCMGIDDARENT